MQGELNSQFSGFLYKVNKKDHICPSIRPSVLFDIVPATKRFVGFLLNLVLESSLGNVVEQTYVSENLHSNFHILYSLTYRCIAPKIQHCTYFSFYASCLESSG
jgi:hypothetical protein